MTLSEDLSLSIWTDFRKLETEDQIRLVVEKLDKNRIETVHVYLPPKADSGLEENDN